MPKLSEIVDPKTLEWLELWKKENQNPKLNQPKKWYKTVKNVVKNTITATSSKENV